MVERVLHLSFLHRSDYAFMTGLQVLSLCTTMLKSKISIVERQESTLYLFLFLTTLLIRLPFFFRDHFDWDESTFIIMGQSVADGNLPYEHMWDLKPPLLFYIIGFVQELFPDSLIAIRFLGVLFIFLSSVVIYRIISEAGLRNGFIAALLYIFLSSYNKYLQGVMSEHISVLFILLGLLYYLRKPVFVNLLLTGVAFGCAVFCKLNYAYGILLLLLFHVFMLLREGKIRFLIFSGTIITAGIVLTGFFVALPYIIEQKFQLFMQSVFMASFEYGHSADISLWYRVKATGVHLLLITGLAMISIKMTVKENRKYVFPVIALLTGTAASFFSTGKISDHYLLQVYPFIAILAAAVMVKRTLVPGFRILIPVLMLLSFRSFIQYYKVAKNLLVHNTPYHGASYYIVNELTKRKLNGKKIFFYYYHFSYWLMDTYPLTKSTTHPSNIGRPFLFKYFDNPRQTTLQELQFMMEKVKPEVLVANKEESWFEKGTIENKYMNKMLSTHFNIVVENEKEAVFIWKRKG